MTARFDPSLYLVVGPRDTAGRPVDRVVLAAIAGGATMVQLRWKEAATETFVAAARELIARIRPLGIPLLINDRVDVALAAGADGVHVGQEDMTPAEARRLIGPEAIIGLSVTTLREADGVEPGIVDYVGIGPVFPTGSKPGAAPAIGVAGLTAIRRRVKVPAVAIGGVRVDRAPDLLRSGVDGLAVVSAIAGAADPEAATRQLKAALDHFRVDRDDS